MSEIKTLTINGQTFTVADPDAAHIDDTAVGEKAWSSRRVMAAVEEVDSSAAILCHAQGLAVTLFDASNRPLKGLTLYGKTTQNGTPTPDAPIALKSVGADGNIVVTVAGKNFLNNNCVSVTRNGVTFTVNEDGSIKASGTASQDTYIKVGEAVLESGVKYTLSGCPSGGSTTTYMLYNNSKGIYDLGSGNSFTADGSVYEVWLKIGSGCPTSNLLFKPMLRLADTSAEYEPYQNQILAVATSNGLNGLGEDRDYIDFQKGVSVQRVFTKAFDGTENWTSYYDKMFRLALPFASTANPATAHGRCSHYPTIDHYTAFTNRENAGYLSYDTTGTTLDIVDNINGNGDVAAFKAFLAEQYAAGTPVTVQYTLLEPIETSLTAEELAAYAVLHTNKPNTVVTNDAGAEMALAYVADTKAYIDNKLAQLT